MYPKFPLGEKVLLSKDASFPLENGKVKNKVSFLNYNEQNSLLEVEKKKKILFVSNLYYPGWKVKVDGIPQEIYKADLAFRAVLIPECKHKVEFSYQPEFFYKGLKISFFLF